MYQRTVDELQDELDSFERRLLAPASSFYKRKIYDLEAICCADLNRVRSRFVRSLQAVENTIDSIEELHPRRIESPACQCTAKNPSVESNAAACRHQRSTSNARYDRTPRSKYVRVCILGFANFAWSRLFKSQPLLYFVTYFIHRRGKVIANSNKKKASKSKTITPSTCSRFIFFNDFLDREVEYSFEILKILNTKTEEEFYGVKKIAILVLLL